MPGLVLVFQLLVIVSSGAALVLVKENDKLIALRLDLRRQVDPWVRVQRHMRFLEAISLCIAVIYGAVQSWEPWPPIVLYIIVRCSTLISQIIAVRREAEQLARLKVHVGLRGARRL